MEFIVPKVEVSCLANLSKMDTGSEGIDGGYSMGNANGGGSRDGASGCGSNGKVVMIIVVVTTMVLEWWQWLRRRQ
ncbi:hypothetical protein M0R45_034665 [Rubus argutus]|uniref:Uncharacterized protein n=1 Tax=Rubus argutus TaxID=59490 RepID=A0AAW1VSH3_RUBAR